MHAHIHHTGEKVMDSLAKHAATVLCVSWSHDGKYLATGGMDRAVCIWDMTATMPQQASVGTLRARCMVKKEDVAAGAPAVGTLAGKELSPKHENKRRRVGDGGVAHGVADAGMRRASAKLVCHVRGHTGWVKTVAWSPDNVYVASGGELDQQLCVWDVALAVAAEPMTVNCRSGHELERGALTFPTRHAIPHVNFTRLACTKCPFSMVSGQDAMKCQQCGYQICLACADSKKYLKATRYIPGPYTGQKYNINAVVWLSDCMSVLSVRDTGYVRIWRALGPEETVHAHNGQTIRAVDWSHDRKHVVTAGEDGTVQIWDALVGGLASSVRKGAVAVLKGHAGAVRAVAWSPDGRHIASGGADKAVRVWDCSTWEHAVPTLARNSYAVTYIAWCPNGEYMVTSDGQKVVIWKCSTWQEAMDPIIMGNTNVSTVSWSPDGSYFANASEIWHVHSHGKTKIDGMAGKPEYADVWSPDGRNIAGCQCSHMLRADVWDVATGKLAASVRTHDKQTHMTWVRPASHTCGSAERALSSSSRRARIGKFLVIADGNVVRIFLLENTGKCELEKPGSELEKPGKPIQKPGSELEDADRQTDDGLEVAKYYILSHISGISCMEDRICAVTAKGLVCMLYVCHIFVCMYVYMEDRTCAVMENGLVCMLYVCIHVYIYIYICMNVYNVTCGHGQL